MEKEKKDFTWEAMDDEIRLIVDQEARKPLVRMNMDLIIDGLDYLHPFNEDEDMLRTEVAWKVFLRDYIEQYVQRCRKKKTLRTIVAVAFLLSMAIATGICYALGIDIWSFAIQWTKEQLNIFVSPVAVEDVHDNNLFEYDNQVREIWGDDICDALEEKGLRIELPSWMPEGYKLQFYESTDLGEGTYIMYGCYSSEENKMLTITIQQYQDFQIFKEGELTYEADENIQREYISQDRRFNIMSNLEDFTVMWWDDSCSIVISGEVSFEEISEMIKSIPQ